MREEMAMGTVLEGVGSLILAKEESERLQVILGGDGQPRHPVTYGRPEQHPATWWQALLEQENPGQKG